MKKAKSATVNDVSKSQAQRLLETVRAKQAGGSGQSFAQSMGKATLRMNGRKTAKGGVGGGTD